MPFGNGINGEFVSGPAQRPEGEVADHTEGQEASAEHVFGPGWKVLDAEVAAKEIQAHQAEETRSPTAESGQEMPQQ